MQYIKIFIIAVLIILAVAFSIITIVKYINDQRSSDEKLKIMDEKFLNDSLIYDGGIFVMDATSNKSHKIGKGDVHNKKFYLASVSKLFTHSVVFQLLDEKLLDYEGTISSYLDFREWQGILCFGNKDLSGTITIRDLLNQTSGLADYESSFLRDGKHIFDALLDEDFAICYESAIDATKTLRPIHKPGHNESAYYSNLNALLLGRICEVTCKKSLDLIFKERIFDKIDLSNTHVAKNTVDVVPVHFDHQARNPIKYISSALAAGGLVSDLNDSMKFIQVFFAGDLFDKDHLNNIHFKSLQFFPIKYGHGMMKVEMSPILSPFVDAPLILGHSGSTGSFAFYLKERNTFIVGTTNQVKSNPYKYIYGYLDAMK